MKVPSSSRSRSGLAWASCSSSIRAGSILGLTVIVVSFFELVLADHSKDHAVAVTYAGDTHTDGAIHHCAGRNFRPVSVDEDRAWRCHSSSMARDQHQPTSSRR